MGQVTGLPLWFNAVTVMAICGAVRSLFLLYYWFWDEEESVDVEEAKWFWVGTGILVAVLGIMGIAYFIPVNVDAGGGIVLSTSLFARCDLELRDFIQNGSGSMALRTLAFSMMTVFVVFAYVAGKWALLFGARILQKE